MTHQFKNYLFLLKTLILIGILKTISAQNTAPTCPSVIVNLDVNETTPIGTTLYTISCTDTDPGDNGTLSYAITSGNGGSEFQISTVAGEGVLDMNALIDYETLFPNVSPAYTLVVTVSDGGTPALTYDVTIDVNLIGLNEDDPIFFLFGGVSIAEDLAVDSNVVSTIPIDFDSGVDGEFTVSILSQSPGTNVFIADPVTGDIKLRKALDYESVQSYTIKTQVTDKGTPARSSTIDIAVTITDINDNSPDCGSTTQYYVTITEAAVADDLIQALTCTDAESGTSLIYRIHSGDSTKFKVLTDGSVRLNSQIDVDTETSEWPLVIRIMDTGSPQLTSFVNIDVLVEGVDDIQPVWSAPESGTYSVSIDENSAIGTIVTIISATDGDTANTTDSQITYGIETSTTVFSIEPLTGQIYVSSATIDRETTASYTLSVSAYSSNQTDNKILGTVTITVNDLNDVVPTFDQAVYTVSLPEDTALSVGVILTVAATDTDQGVNGQITYSISSGNTASGCGHTIDGVSGGISLGESLNYEAATKCEFIVVATDGGTPALSSTAIVIIIVTPVNENTPAFGGPYTFSVSEDATYGTSIGTVAATDTDAGDDGIVLYSLNNHTDKFIIEASTGVLKLNTALDRETTASYNVEVLAIDQSTTNNLTASVTVTVNVDDVNDVTPAFGQDVYTVSLAEDTALSVGAVLTVGATDTDQGVNSQITYSISSGNTATGCGHTIDGTTGEISLGENRDYESSTTCTLVIVATDGGTPALSSSADAIIIVTPVNEITPTFGGPYTFPVLEDATYGTSLGTVAATDTDAGDDGVVLYSLNSHADKFIIEPTTGVLRLNTALDRETTPSYSVEVLATDQSTTTQLNGTVTVTVNVNDVNDNGPICVDVTYVTLTSTVNVGDIVYNATCSDADSGLNGDLTYNILSGNTNTDYAISGTGQLTVQNPLSQTDYSINIQVSDQGTPALTASIYALITVEVNPTFDSFLESLSVNESETLGTVIDTIAATASSGFTTFEIISGNAENKFKINKYLGALYLIAPLDRETTDTYTIGIRVTDSVTGLTQDNITTITVIDVNDNAPVFASTYYERSIAETVTPTLLVVSLPATDNDINQNAAVTYSIADGNADGKFNIDASGDLTMVATVDAETTLFYTLTVTATDSGSPSQLTGTTIVLVTITNADEYTPQFLVAGGTYTHSLYENATVGANLFNVTAQDLDVGTQITYAITGGNTANKFVIESLTGAIYLSNYLDREIVDSYVLILEADNGVGATATGTLSITVDDVNDNDPTFNQLVYSYSIIETSTIGVSVGEVTCSDIDLGANAVFGFSIVGGNTGNAFGLDTNIIEVNSTLDYETVNKYILLIEALDSGIPARSSTATVIIDILPFYTQPRFASITPTLTMSENSALGTTFYDLDATLSGSTEGTTGDLFYYLQSGNTYDKFAVDILTGEVSIIGELDRENTTSYNLFFTAENKNDPTKRDSLTLIITIDDVNDNSPIFTTSSYIFLIDEDSATTTSVGTVTAQDVDAGTNGAVSYAFVAGESMSDFAIDPSSGEVTVNGPLSATVKDSYYITVQASDGGSPSKTTSTNILITVNDVNDHTPTFSSPTFSIQVSENASVTQELYQFTADDADIGSNALLTYTIIAGNGDGKFTFDALTGVLKLVNVLDRETKTSYTITIQAQDAAPGLSSRSGTAVVTITVTDVNDNYPQFQNLPYTSTVARTVAVGNSVEQVTATDIDDGINSQIQYYIESGNTDNLFLVDDSTGLVTTIGELSSASDTYSLICIAVDKGYNRLTSTATITVIVDPPYTPGVSDFSFTISEDAPVSSSVGTISQDPIHPPGATIHYTIIGGNNGNDFQISLIGGVISNANPLDRETYSNYYLTVNLQDINNPITYNKLVHINVTDVNDVTPNFATASGGSGVGPVNIYIVENMPVGFSVYTATAVDGDEDLSGQITYSISNANPSATQMFNIDNTGLVTLKTSPDYELVQNIVFEVLAVDGGSRTGTATIIGNIIDVTDSQNVQSGSSAFFSLECSSDAVNNETIINMTPADFGLTSTASDTVQYITMNDAGVFNVRSNGDFYVQNQDYVYVESRYYMWVVVRVTDFDNNVTANSGMVRVDTFNPSENVVIIGHSVTKDIVEPQTNFLSSELGKLFCSTCRVGIWTIRGYTGTTARRRLLATESESLIYVVSDTATDTMDNLESDKTFLTQSEILQVLQKSSDGTPASSLNTANFVTFPITSVNAYPQSSSTSQNWAQSVEGIAVLCIIAASIVLLAVILTIYFLCTRERKYRFQSDEEHLTKKDAFESPSVSRSPSSVTPPKKDKLHMVAPYKHPDGDEAIKKAKIAKRPENVRALPKVPSGTFVDVRQRKSSPGSSSLPGGIGRQKQNVRVSMMEGAPKDDTFDHIPPKLFRNDRKKFGPRENGDTKSLGGSRPTSTRSESVVTPRNIRIESPLY